MLFARGQAYAIPAMTEAWRKVQPHLLGNKADAYGKAGRLVTFLAKCGDATAIAALGVPGNAWQPFAALCRRIRPFASERDSNTGIANGELQSALGRKFFNCLKSQGRSLFVGWKKAPKFLLKNDAELSRFQALVNVFGKSLHADYQTRSRLGHQ